MTGFELRISGVGSSHFVYSDITYFNFVNELKKVKLKINEIDTV